MKKAALKRTIKIETINLDTMLNMHKALTVSKVQSERKLAVDKRKVVFNYFLSQKTIYR